MKQTIMNELKATADRQNIIHTTIAIRKDTKEKLNKNRASGQCYDDFIDDLIEYWERYRIGSSLCGPGKPIHRVEEI